MIACSVTPYVHHPNTLRLLKRLNTTPNSNDNDTTTTTTAAAASSSSTSSSSASATSSSSRGDTTGTGSVQSQRGQGVHIINSAVFNGGFLIGEAFYNYQAVSRSRNNSISSHDAMDTSTGATSTTATAAATSTTGINSSSDSATKRWALFDWRDKFLSICNDELEVSPVLACIQFGFYLLPSCIGSVALNTSDPAQIRENYHMVYSEQYLPDQHRRLSKLWQRLAEEGLIHLSTE